MSYRLAVLSDTPIAFWPLDEAAGTTFADLSGFGHTGTILGTIDFKRPGLASGMSAALFEGTELFHSQVAGLFVKGAEDQPFTLEIWTKATEAPTAERSLIGREANNAVYLTPEGVEFRMINSAGEIFTAFYVVTDWTKPLHIVATYVGRNLGLRVNGREGTNAYFEGSLANTANTMYVGGGLITSPAIYRKTLDNATVMKHYEHGVRAPRPLDIAQIHGGTYYSLDDDSANVLLSYTINNRIEEDYTTDIEYVGNLENIAGSRIDWQASPQVTVDISFDMGETWTPCVNHAEVPGLSITDDLTNKFFMLRMNFPDDDGNYYFENLSLVVYQSKTSSADKGNSTLGVTGNPTLAQYAYSPAENIDQMGATLPPGTYFTIPGQTEGIQSVEMWFRRDGSGTGYIFGANGAYMRFVAGGLETANINVFVNGVFKTPTIDDFPEDRWVHLIASAVGATTNDILLNADYETKTASAAHSYAHVVTFRGPIDSRTATTRYQMHKGLVNIRQVDSLALTVAERPDGIKAYSFAWASVQSGIS